MTFGISHHQTRCTGCRACEIACMDQHDMDVELGESSLRQVRCVEHALSSGAKIDYISVGCRHCRNAPCVAGCPSGALSQIGDGPVLADPVECVGCRNCSNVCEFGVPRYDRNGKIHKCSLCWERVESGLLPACVRACPTRALSFETAGLS